MDETLNDDLISLTHQELVAEIIRLRAAIRAHRDASGHDLCWYHPELWGLLPESGSRPIDIPDWPEFISGCLRYRKSLEERSRSTGLEKPRTRSG